MKAVILAGGLGSRLSEETHLKPKPMIEIGGRPMLWHILKVYSAYGIHDFIICCGYKGYLIKEYFANYFLHMSDVTFDMSHNKIEVHHRKAEPWKVTVVDTGEHTQTGGRLKRVLPYLDGKPFCFSYGDTLSDVNVDQLSDYHKREGALVTLTAVQPPGRYGLLELTDQKNRVQKFKEKPDGDGAWISGGFFIVEPEIEACLQNDETSWEKNVLESLASKGQLASYCHRGFWQAMDTLREKNLLEAMWQNGSAPWKVWDRT